MFEAERFAAKVVDLLTRETPLPSSQEGEPRSLSIPAGKTFEIQPVANRRIHPQWPRLLLQQFPGAWEAFLDRHPATLLEIAKQRGAEPAFRRRAEELEAGGLWRAEADLDAWVEVVWPTFCIGPELYRLRYGMLPEEILMEEIEMEERKSRSEALSEHIKALRQGTEPEDGGFLVWFLEEAQEDELRQLLDAERKVQRGLWPEWEDEEALAAWVERLDGDWEGEFLELGGTDLERAQALARLQSFVRARSILNAAKRLGYAKVTQDYGASGKLAEEKR